MLLAAASAASGTVGGLWVGGWPERVLDAALAALAGGLGCLVLWLSVASSVERRHARRRAALEVRRRARVAERVAGRRREQVRERSSAAMRSARSPLVDSPVTTLTSQADPPPALKAGAEAA